jgi:hypothetical protein
VPHHDWRAVTRDATPGEHPPEELVRGDMENVDPADCEQVEFANTYDSRSAGSRQASATRAVA